MLFGGARAIKSIAAFVKVAARGRTGRGRTVEFEERQFHYPLCVDRVSLGHDKYFPAECTMLSTPDCPFGFPIAAAFDRNHENLDRQAESERKRERQR